MILVECFSISNFEDTGALFRYYDELYEKGRSKRNFQQVHTLKGDGMGVNEIARRLGIRKATVIGWLGKTVYEDDRGWKEGQKRIYTSEMESRIVTLKQDMIERKDYFLGAPYVQMHYAGEYPNEQLPSEWFIKEVTRRHNLQTHEPKQRTKGQDIVSRLRFPIKSIVTLGRIQQAADFIGKKFITGRTEPISIFSTSYYQWLKMYQIRRVLAETAESAIESLSHFWTKFPIPNVLRIDNGMTFRGTGRGSAHIGRFVKFLLNAGITPLFSAAYQSYTNPHIEGHNSTFTQKLWSKHRFSALEDIDHECTRFNEESERFYQWKFKERLAQKSLRYLLPDYHVSSELLRSTKGKKVCFIRFVQRWKETENRYGIVVLNRFITLKPEYNNQYVFVELNLETATIHVYSEHEGIRSKIFQYPFPFICVHLSTNWPLCPVSLSPEHRIIPGSRDRPFKLWKPQVALSGQLCVSVYRVGVVRFYCNLNR